MDAVQEIVKPREQEIPGRGTPRGNSGDLGRAKRRLLFFNICSSENNTMGKALDGINDSSRILSFLPKVCAQRNIGHRDR